MRKLGLTNGIHTRMLPPMGTPEHWDAIYGKRPATEVSWYRPHLERSLRFVEQARLRADAAILDVGGGASTLVDDLLDRGFTNLTVLDLSAAAIARSQARLGPRAGAVTWIVGDVTQVELPAHQYDFWHDRAVFHFLDEASSRDRYVQAVRSALKPGGHIVVATFGPSGPERCSGLPVVRYTPEGIHEQFGGQFRKVGNDSETHQTPWGSEQEFVYCYCRLAD
ncbi:MAG TPA: class I SAM-dependent methyltransferase [Candidatus Eisenbacteria bacterium]